MEVWFLAPERFEKVEDVQNVNEEKIVEMGKKLNLGDEFIFAVWRNGELIWEGQYKNGGIELSLGGV